jgi:DNA-binding response OmpR family regulator
VARVLLLSTDLLFGSNVQGALTGAGQAVERVAGEDGLRDALIREPPRALVVDLTDQELQATQIVSELRQEGFLKGVPVLGYYSHVEPAVRELALAEGFTMAVPRSRMAREAAQLVAALVGD